MAEERKVSVISEEQTGQTRIADEVIAIIADLAIRDVKGIITPGNRKLKHSYGKGFNIRVEGNDVYCDVSVILKSGVRLMQVVEPIQKKVKAGIENMLEMNVKEVNVCVIGIQKEKSSEDAER